MRLLLALLFVLQIGAARACSVPVFRYALDRWPVAEYHVELPDNAKNETLLRELLADAAGNVRFERVEREGDAARLMAPSTKGDPLWAGHFSKESFALIMDSPARRELARRILSGDSVVWVIVSSSGDHKAISDKLEPALAKFQSTAKLPEIRPEHLGPGPALRIGFSILHVRVDDPAEAAFVAMLAGADKARPPFIAPVFGRGRVLATLPADQINAAGIEKACQFLTGSCSCELDVGWDLLMAVDWFKELKKLDARPPAAVKAPAAAEEPATSRAPEAKAFEPSVDAPRKADSASRPIHGLHYKHWIAIAAIFVFGVILYLSTKLKS